MKILVAESEQVAATLLQKTLTAMGHEVVLATDGAAAWQILQEQAISIVIADWMLQGLDGPALCRQIRSRDETVAYTYIILTTARRIAANRIEGLRAGANDFLVKPVDPEELALRLEIARRILSVQERLESQNAQLAELNSTDKLSSLMSRPVFRATLEAKFALASCQQMPLSLVLLDIDRFKNFNDRFGHPAGDVALRLIAEALVANCREHEEVARYGGEEFAVILLGANAEISRRVAERIRTSLAERNWPSGPLTVSLGIATTGPEVRTPSDLIEQANLALYSSKSQGRDRVTHFDDNPDESCLMLQPLNTEFAN